MDLGLVSSESPIKQVAKSPPVNEQKLYQDTLKIANLTSPMRIIGDIKKLSENPIFGDISPKRRPKRVLSPECRSPAPIDDTPIEVDGQQIDINSIAPIIIPSNINTKVDISNSVNKLPKASTTVLSPIKKKTKFDFNKVDIPVEIITPKPKKAKKRKTKKGKSIIPDYDNMTKDKQCQYSAILDQRINRLKEKWPNYEFPNFAHLTTREKHIYYLSYLRHYNICNNIIIGRLILYALWAAVEILCSIFLNIQIVGFCKRQMQNMDIYDRFLIEIQENMTPEINLEAGGSTPLLNSWEPIYKLLGLSALITVVVIIISLIVRKYPAAESILQPLGDKFINMFVGPKYEVNKNKYEKKIEDEIDHIPKDIDTKINLPVLGETDISNFLSDIGPMILGNKEGNLFH